MKSYDELKGLLEYLDEARPAPWIVVNDNEGTEYNPLWVVTNENSDDDGEYFVELHVGDSVTADFIAEARNNMPELLAEIEDLRKRLSEIHALTENYKKDYVGYWVDRRKMNKMKELSEINTEES